ncbi:MFS transporter, partial [Enterococcus faecalis]
NGKIIGPKAAGALIDNNHNIPYYVTAEILLGTGFISILINRKKMKNKKEIENK